MDEYDSIKQTRDITMANEAVLRHESVEDLESLLLTVKHRIKTLKSEEASARSFWNMGS